MMGPKMHLVYIIILFKGKTLIVNSFHVVVIFYFQRFKYLFLKTKILTDFKGRPIVQTLFDKCSCYRTVLFRN